MPASDRRQRLLVCQHDVDGRQAERVDFGVERGLEVVVERHRAEHGYHVIACRQVGAVQRMHPAVGIPPLVDRHQRVDARQRAAGQHRGQLSGSSADSAIRQCDTSRAD
jgi:hypothetical protein